MGHGIGEIEGISSASLVRTKRLGGYGTERHFGEKSSGGKARQRRWIAEKHPEIPQAADIVLYMGRLNTATYIPDVGTDRKKVGPWHTVGRSAVVEVQG